MSKVLFLLFAIMSLSGCGANGSLPRADIDSGGRAPDASFPSEYVPQPFPPPVAPKANS